MNWYLILKFVHVAAVVTWLGGAGALVFAAAMMSTFKERTAVLQVVAFLSNRLFIPSLVVVLLAGGTMWWVGALNFDAWVAYGLAGIILTGGIGALVLGPTSERLAGLLNSNAAEAEVKPQLFKLLRGAQADIVGLATIVFAMVMKPTWSDPWMLVGMIVVGAAGAAYFLTRPTPQA